MNNYLLPEAIKDAGLSDRKHQFEFTQEAADFVINNYAREPGVRSLKNFTKRIYEKIAFKIVDSDTPDTEHIKVDLDDLEAYIGNPPFSSKRIYEEKQTPPGVVIGLAYNSIGGSILFIEATKASQSKLTEASNGSLRITGQLGDVMKESSTIA